MKWLERQLLMAMTGWPPDVVNGMSRLDVRTTLIFRSELEQVRKG